MGTGSGAGREQRPVGGVARRVRTLVVLAGLAGCSEPGPGAAVPAPVASSSAREELEGLGYAPDPAADSVAVSGRVLDPEGRPLADFTIQAIQVSPGGALLDASGPAEVRGSEDGSFSLPRLPPGRTFLLASAPALAPTSSAPFDAPAGEAIAGVTVRMTRGATVEGRVVDAHGADAVPGARVTPFDGGDIHWNHDPFARLATRTDPDGRFRLEHVPAGDCSLRIESAGHATLFVADVHLEEGQVRELPRLAVSLGATVSGVVRAGGSPLPGASVRLTPVDGPHGSRATRADEVGRFRFEHVSAGPHQLSATRPGYAAGDPFQAIGDMRYSQKEIGVAEGESYEFTLLLEAGR